MKQKSLVFLLGIANLLPSYLFAQENRKDFWEKDEFSIQLTIALVAAILSFISAYFIFLRQKKNDKKKQLSYDLKVRHRLIEIGKEIDKSIKIEYKNFPTDNLSIIDFSLQNTGNIVIKNQEVRFTLESKSEFIDGFFEPIPEPEWKVEEMNQLDNKNKRIKIGHLEKNQKISLQFIISGEDAKVKIIPHNEEGDVEFNPRSFTQKQDEVETLNRFFTILFFIIISYFILDGIETNRFGFTPPISIPSFVILIILIFGFKYIVKGIKIIAYRFLQNREEAQILIKDSKNIVVDSALDIGNDFRLGDYRYVPDKENDSLT